MLQPLRRGSVVHGQVMRRDEDGILVSVGHKMEGFIPLREMRSVTSSLAERYAVGAVVLAFVLDPAGTDGQALLSIDRARGEEAWHALQEHAKSGEPVEGQIVGYNRGGAVVDVGGLQAFVPLSQVLLPDGSEEPEQALAKRVGEHLTFKVLEVNRRRNRAVLSERAIVREHREDRKERLLTELVDGEVRRGKVTGISSFGAFVDLGGADGLIHISELSWSPVSSVDEVLQVGQEVDVYVLRVDKEQRRIALSLRRLSPTPWETAKEYFRSGQLVTGTVTKLADFGAFARLDDGLEGLIHVSELSDRHIRHPREVVHIGDTLTLRVVSVDLERRRIGLSLKQAEDYPVQSAAESYETRVSAVE